MPIEDFTLIEVIGKGSFGKVHKARHNGTGAIVALKFIEKRQKNLEGWLKTLRRDANVRVYED